MIAIDPLVIVAGHSVQNRPIGLYLFNADENLTLDTLFVGVVHGDEGISGQLMGPLLGGLSKGECTIPDNKPVGIIQQLNPDGLATNTRVNANGVDLNRNCPTQTWTSEHESPDYNPGPYAGSEPETQVLISAVEKYQPKKIITVHSPYKVLNFDGEQSRPLAEAMAKKSGYPVVEDIGYSTPGSMGTYFGKERNFLMVTLELPPCEPDEGWEPLDKVWQDNCESLLAAIAF